MRLLIFLQFLFYCNASTSQTLTILTSGEKTSIRGLSVVSDKIIWASGSNGMIARSIDGGNSWKWLRVKGFEKTDFRDIEAFDATTAVIMGIAEPAYILKTHRLISGHHQEKYLDYLLLNLPLLKIHSAHDQMNLL